VKNSLGLCAGQSFAALILLAISAAMDLPPADAATVNGVRDGFRGFVSAMRDGDPAKAQSFLYIKGDADGKEAEAGSKLLVAMHHLAQSASQKFDAQSVKDMDLSDSTDKGLDKVLAGISTAKVELTAVDRATLAPTDVDHPTMVHVGNSWKVDMTDMVQSPAPGAKRSTPAALSKAAATMESIAARISSGEIKTSDAASSAVAAVMSLIDNGEADRLADPAIAKVARDTWAAALKAQRDGDAAQIKASIYIADDAGGKLGDMAVDIYVALRHVHLSADKAFGEKKVTENGDFGQSDAQIETAIALVPAAAVNQTSDGHVDVVISHDHESETIHMVKMEGQWKVDATGELFHKGQTQAKSLAAGEAFLKSVRELDQKINAGEIKSVDEAAKTMDAATALLR
jgi:hypothetical protein